MSFANEETYNIGLDSEKRSELTSLKCKEIDGKISSGFKISEIEVWEVIFEK
jgi:hypothetical protein